MALQAKLITAKVFYYQILRINNNLEKLLM
jgi:hypothetical protein